MPERSHLPHLAPFARHPIVFLTVVTADRRRLLDNAAALQVLTEIWRNSVDVDGWAVGDFLLMPDHVHLFARAASDAKPLAKWIGGWKSISARRIRGATGTKGALWQSDYFDRFLRSAENYAAKWDYVAANPVRAGLSQRPEDWPWRGRLHDLRF
jgi:putative transposase